MYHLDFLSAGSIMMPWSIVLEGRCKGMRKLSKHLQASAVKKA